MSATAALEILVRRMLVADIKRAPEPARELDALLDDVACKVQSLCRAAKKEKGDLRRGMVDTAGHLARIVSGIAAEIEPPAAIEDDAAD